MEKDKKYIMISFDKGSSEFDYLLNLEKQNINISKFVRNLISKEMLKNNK